MKPFKTVDSNDLAFFESVMPGRVFAGEDISPDYDHDEMTIYGSYRPEAVLQALKTEEISAVLKYCNERNIAVTPRGSGTGLCGGCVPKDGGVVLSTEKMKKVLEVDAKNMTATVEPGVLLMEFPKSLEGTGLFYPPDPGSQAVSTIGGNIAENAGGLRGLKYGVTKDYVMGLEFYDAEGGLVKTGSRTVKCATGFNLAGLMTGSEGAFGIISKAILKLVPPPRASKAMTAAFSDVRRAADTVAEIIASHVLPCTLEFMDAVTINMVEDDVKIGLPRDAKALLLIEVNGHPAQVADDADTVERILRENGAANITVARDEIQKNAIWEARRKALPALARRRPTIVLEDATVARSKIPAMVDCIGDIAKKYGLLIGTFGHAGDGNLHPSILCDKRDPQEFARVEQAIDELFRRTVEMGGTLSGEHGTGTAKSKWLELETSAATLKFCRALRSAVDSKRLLNPTKVVAF